MNMVPPWLVVEDEEDDFFLVARCCARLVPRVEVVRATHGRDAQESLLSATTLPALILSDISMPHVNGIELLKWVKSQPMFATIPFVFLTNSSSITDRQQASALGAEEFLTKPMGIQALGDMLRALATRWCGHKAAPLPDLPASAPPRNSP